MARALADARRRPDPAPPPRDRFFERDARRRGADRGVRDGGAHPSGDRQPGRRHPHLRIADSPRARVPDDEPREGAGQSCARAAPRQGDPLPRRHEERRPVRSPTEAKIACRVNGTSDEFRERLSVNPGKTVSCLSRGKIGTGATIDRTWSFRATPAGSTAKMTIAPGEGSIRFSTDAFGTYSVGLDVTDDLGRTARATTDVNVAPPKDALVVQMLWTKFQPEDDPSTFPRVELHLLGDKPPLPHRPERCSPRSRRGLSRGFSCMATARSKTRSRRPGATRTRSRGRQSKKYQPTRSLSTGSASTTATTATPASRSSACVRSAGCSRASGATTRFGPRGTGGTSGASMR